MSIKVVNFLVITSSVGLLCIKMCLQDFNSMTTDDICEERVAIIRWRCYVGNFKQNKIDGIAFIELNDEYLWELYPGHVLGDHMKIKKTVQTCIGSISFPSIPRSCTLNSSNISKRQTPYSSLCSDDTVLVCVTINFLTLVFKFLLVYNIDNVIFLIF